MKEEEKKLGGSFQKPNSFIGSFRPAVVPDSNSSELQKKYEATIEKLKKLDAEKNSWIESLGLTVPPHLIYSEEGISEGSGEKRDRLRQKVEEEFISTEKFYRYDLNILLNQISNVISLKDLDSAILEEFKNANKSVLDIQQVSQTFWDILVPPSSYKGKGFTISESFLKVAEELKMYANYCSSHPRLLASLQKLNEMESFLEYERKLQSTSNGLDFGAFLIKPIQRICKYPILLKELLRNTSEEHEEYSSLVEAVNRAERLLEYINEEKRNAEKRQKLEMLPSKLTGLEFELIVPDRLLELELFVVSDKAENMVIWVLTDCILWAKYAKKDDSFKYKGHIPSISLRVTDIQSTGNEEIAALQVQNRDQPGMVQSFVPSTLQDRRILLNAMKKSIKDTFARNKVNPSSNHFTSTYNVSSSDLRAKTSNASTTSNSMIFDSQRPQKNTNRRSRSIDGDVNFLRASTGSSPSLESPSAHLITKTSSEKPLRAHVAQSLESVHSIPNFKTQQNSSSSPSGLASPPPQRPDRSGIISPGPQRPERLASPPPQRPDRNGIASSGPLRPGIASPSPQRPAIASLSPSGLASPSPQRPEKNGTPPLSSQKSLNSPPVSPRNFPPPAQNRPGTPPNSGEKVSPTRDNIASKASKFGGQQNQPGGPASSPSHSSLARAASARTIARPALPSPESIANHKTSTR